ncbi:MAG: efflux transporter periplasmic adaptor subunit [Bacteroidetes bacterium MedPE-SWsnd-G1]|nr:MAG: efflux transporter periplasmic adaptor subunit [Bacteroidetes bacterium MedPE-SWsnd-G1]
MRQLIIIIATVALLVIGYFTMSALGNSKKGFKPKTEKLEKVAFVNTVQNGVIPIKIKANGNLTAKNKVEIFSEVQGVLQVTSKEFRPGVQYRKGQTILMINSDEHYANLQSQKSMLQNLIASIMPDIRLDYPNSFDVWNNYLSSFNVDSSVKPLPEPGSEQEKYFITGKNIYTTYYNVKNLEARLQKYNIVAPFNGILTETSVNTGALVRSGQKMGEFIDPTVFEMEIAINAAYADLLKVGKEVTLFNLDKSSSWLSKVVRINGRVDQRSQTVNIYVEVRGDNLREGMYLEANVPGRDELDAYQIARKVLIDNKAVFVVEDNILKLQEVNIIHFDESTAVIKGLQNGTKIVSKQIPGAYEGMTVKIIEE